MIDLPCLLPKLVHKGCSLKTQGNLDVMALVPSDRLMIETDCPWCDIRSTHAGRQYIKTVPEAKDKKKHGNEWQVKGRNEPSNLIQVIQLTHQVIDGMHGRTDGSS